MPKICRNSFPQGSHRLYRGTWQLSGGTGRLLQRIKKYPVAHHPVKSERLEIIFVAAEALFFQHRSTTRLIGRFAPNNKQKKGRKDIGLRPRNPPSSTLANQNIELVYYDLQLIACCRSICVAPIERIQPDALDNELPSHGNTPN